METVTDSLPTDDTATEDLGKGEAEVDPKPEEPVEATEPSISPKRTAAPPKRPLTTAKRPIGSTTASTSKPSATAATRTAPGSTLSKPPTRPMTSTTARKTTATPSSHQSRASISSVEDSKKAITENRKPAATGAPRKVSLTSSNKPADTKATSVSSSSVRRTTLGTGTAERKPLATRSAATTTPTKETSRSTTSTRPSTLSGATRTTRPVVSTKTGPSPNTEANRRSTNTAAALATKSLPTTSKSTSKDGNATRPALGQRKSTMSVSLEQRLKEMNLVHEMLRVAMADEADESDVAKEAAEQQMDETLANLKNKLEEARRNEGKDPVSAAGEDTSINDAASVKNNDVTQAELEISREKVSSLEAELKILLQKFQEFREETERASKDVEIATEKIRLEHSERLDKVLHEHEEALAKMSENHESELGKQSDNHVQELKNIKTDFATKEAASAEAAAKALAELEDAKRVADQIKSEENSRALDELKQAHAESLKELEKNMNKQLSEKDSRIEEQERQHQNTLEQKSDEAKKAQLEAITQQLDAAKAAAEQGAAETSRLLEEEKKAHDSAIKALEDSHVTKMTEKDSALAEFVDKQKSQDHEVAALKTQLLEKDNEIDRLDRLHKAFTESSSKDLETARTTATEQKALEISRLLDEEKKAHDSALKELEDKLTLQKNSALAELEKVNKELNVANVAATESAAEASRLLDEEKKVHESALQTLNDEHAAQITEKNSALAELEKLNKELDAAKVAATEQSTSETSRLIEEERRLHGDSLKDLETRLTSQSVEKDATIADLKTESSELRDQLQARNNAVSTVEKVVDGLQAELRELKEEKESEIKTLTTASTSLKAELQAARDIAKKDAGLSERIDAKDTEITKLGKVIEDMIKLQELKNQECERLGEELKLAKATIDDSKENSKSLETAKTEFHALQQELANKVAEHDTIYKLNADLKLQLEDQTTQTSSFKKMLETFDDESKQTDKQHAQEVEKLKEEAAKLKEDYVRATTQLEEQNSFASAKEAENVTAMQEARSNHNKKLEEINQKHEIILSELQQQVIEHRKALSETETKLQTNQEQVTTVERQMKELTQELDEARVLLANAKSELAGSLEEVASQHQRIQTLTSESQKHKEMDLQHQSALESLRNDIANINAENGAKDEKREAERKQGAEVRDGLVKQLAEANKSLEQRTHELHTSLSSRSKLDEDLASLRAENERIQKESRHRSQSVSKHQQQELELLRTQHKEEMASSHEMLRNEQEQNSELKQQIVEGDEAQERHAARLREVEAELKAKEAELNALNTKLVKISKPMATKSMLGGSRWAPEATGNGDETEDLEGMDMGSHIEGAMAGIQEQVKQLATLNADMIDDSERMVNRLPKPSFAVKAEAQSSGLDPKATPFRARDSK